MAQTGIGGYFPVRRRTSDHGSVKRRKLSESTRLDIPVLSEQADPLSIPCTQPEKVIVSEPKTKKSARGRQKRGVNATTRSSTTRSRRSKCAKSNQESLKTLLDIISQSKLQEATQKPSSKDGDSAEEESPLPPPTVAMLSPSPRKRANNTQPHTPSKMRIVESSNGSHTPVPSPFKTPQASPFKTFTPSKLPQVSPGPFKMASPKPKLSPRKTPLRVETRGATLLRLAQEKMVKSPAKNLIPPTSPNIQLMADTLGVAATTSRSEKMRARRRLLTDPDPNSLLTPAPKMEASSGTHEKDPTEREMISNLYKLSARELAQQTRFETNTAKRRMPAPKTTKLQEFVTLEVESPKKSSHQPPAYERYHSLAHPSSSSSTQSPLTPTPPPSTDLPLPHKYQLLAEKFRCTDTVVTMLQKRKEICSLDKLRRAVQEMTRRNFEQRNLAQMKTVYPTVFVFRQEKHIPGIYNRKQYEQYQLTVECNTSEDGSGGGGGVRGHITTTGLVQRRKRFHSNLTQIVKSHHQAFLASLQPPLSIPEEKVLRWHPAFQLDSVPDVEEAELPKPPITETYTTARDVLNATQNRLTPRVQQALANVARERENNMETRKDRDSTKTELDPSLRGIPEALLEKIRKKEAARAEAKITRDPMKEKKLEMLARLPEFCRILRMFFIGEKRAAIPWEDVVQKLSESHSSGLPPDRVEDHLGYLQKLIPSWISCVTIRKRSYVKIKKNSDFKDVTRQLEEAEKQLRSC